jgi:heme-degrading monooxygenase HmoA
LPFIVFAFRVARQAKTAQGNLGVSLLRDAHNTYWTLTVWTTESAMKAFMLAGPHKKAMRRLSEWCDEAALVHWQQEDDQQPDWSDAHRRLQTEGRRSKVNHPSPAQEKFQIPAPKTRGQ